VTITLLCALFLLAHTDTSSDAANNKVRFFQLLFTLVVVAVVVVVAIAPFGDFGKNADKINDHESQNDESGTAETPSPLKTIFVQKKQEFKRHASQRLLCRRRR
jgi:hypothetical protein